MNEAINTLSFEYIDRDISWLDFNYRVLQEAKDKSVPLLERLKFLAIYSSNLGEFFRIRVAHHRNLKKLGKIPKVNWTTIQANCSNNFMQLQINS